MILGVIAVSQKIFIPGWIASYFIGFFENTPKRLITTLGLSLIFNYWIIFILTFFRIYNLYSLAIIIISEIVLLAFIYKKKISEVNKKTLDELSSNFIFKIKNYLNYAKMWIDEELSEKEDLFPKLAISLSAIGTVVYCVYLLVGNVGTIFDLWDPIISWNRWAVEWSLNTLPKNSWEYPQLIPANWSIAYTLLGAPIEYFSKIIMPLFPLAIVSAFIVVGLNKKSWSYIVAAPATIFLIRILNGSEIMATEGYVDTAVTFFSTMSLLCLLWTDKNTTDENLTKNIMLGALFAAGAAMTKQAGLYIVVIYPLLAWIFILKDNIYLRQKFLKYLIGYAGIIILLVGPYYAYKQFSIANKTDVSVVPTVINLIYGNGKKPINITLEAIYYLITKTHGVIAIYFLFSIFALKNRKIGWLVGLIIIPWTIIWALFLSYDTRNFSLAIPFLGLGTGIGLEMFRSKIENLKKVKIFYAFMILFLALIAINPWLSKKIDKKYNNDKRIIYNEELSLLIDNYFKTNQIEGKIYSNFPILYFLPITAQNMYSPYGTFSPNKNDFETYFEINSDETIGYIFAADYTNDMIKKDIDEKLKTGQYKSVLDYNGFEMIKINK